MLSYQNQYELVQSLSSDFNTTNLILFKNLINIGVHKIERSLDIFVNEQTKTFTTITDAVSGTNNQGYVLPRGFISLNSMYVTVGTTQHHMDNLIEDPKWWGQINATTTQSTSNYLKYAHIKGRTIYLWPIPSSANLVTVSYFGNSKDLSQADYTTGTITTLATATKAVVGSGSTWTSQMVNRIFKINDDSEWHYITAAPTATTITLETPYVGTSIAAGTSAYTIGEVCRLPESTHELPVQYALWQYFAFYRRDKFLASMYEKQFKEGLIDAQMEYSTSGSSIIINGRTDENSLSINPNFYPTGLT